MPHVTTTRAAESVHAAKTDTRTRAHTHTGAHTHTHTHTRVHTHTRTHTHIHTYPIAVLLVRALAMTWYSGRVSASLARMLL